MAFWEKLLPTVSTHPLGLAGGVVRRAADDVRTAGERLRQRQRECRRRPAAGGDGDELVLAVRVAGLEVVLERLAPRDDVPGSIVALGRDQVAEPSAVGVVVDGQPARLVQGHEGRASGVGVALHVGELGPAAVLPLRLQ